MVNKWVQVFQMMNSSTKKYLLTFFGIFIIFLLWQIYSIYSNDEYTAPSIFKIFSQIIPILTTKSNIIAILNTFYNLLKVILSASLISFILVFIYALFPSIIYFIRPIIITLKSAPFVIISFYLYLTVERSIAPQIVSFLVVFPIIFEGLVAAIDNIDKTIKDDLALLDISFIKKYTLVYIPICMPYIITSILQTFGLGLKVIIMSECINFTNNSIGGILGVLKDSIFEYDLFLAWLIIIIIIVCLVDFIINLINNKIIKQKY